MRKLVVLLSSLLLVACLNNRKSISHEYYQKIKNNSSTFPDSTELSIALINNDKIVYLGFIKEGDSLICVNNKKSVFGIGSISKIFTSTLLSHLIMKRKIDINEPVENQLNFNLNQTGYDNLKITYKTLANHTSGFPGMPDNYLEITNGEANCRNYNSEVLSDYLRNRIKLKSVSGHNYKYSNLGYATLGYLIEQIQNISYEQILQQDICNKYKLNNTTTDYSIIKDQLVVGRDSSGKIQPYNEYGIFASSGGIYSNVLDLSKYVQANFKQDSLLNYQRQETYRWGNFGIALGWQIWNFGGANCSWYSHDGSLDGYRSACVMNIPSKIAVIVLSNVSSKHKDNDNIVEIASELIKQEYLKNNKNEICCNSFIEVALKNGWGASRRDSLVQNNTNRNSIIGVWQHNANGRKITKTFFEDNKVQTDFYKDEEIDVWGYYEIVGKEISFTDIGGEACIPKGIYNYKLEGDTLRFKVISDKCDGRKAGNLVDWVRIKK